MAHHGAAARDLAAWQTQLGDLERTLASAHKALRSVQLGAIAFQQRHALLGPCGGNRDGRHVLMAPELSQYFCQ